MVVSEKARARAARCTKETAGTTPGSGKNLPRAAALVRKPLSARHAYAILLAGAALGWSVGCGDGNQPNTDRSAPHDQPPHRVGVHSGGAYARPTAGGEVQGHAQPPTPAVSAVRQAHSVVIHFRFPRQGAKLGQPWLLLTSVDSAGSRVPPYTVRTPVPKRGAGVISQSLGVGRPPFRLLVATVSRIGLRSRIIEIPLPE